jgi:dephospho-CoA kinase
MEYSDSLIVAVTGGMGCGQTTVCQFLEKFGAKAINADFVAKREIERNRDVQKELKKTFGSKIFYRNGKLNNKLLARIAFSDEIKTTRLNKIVHPQMVSSIINLIEQARESGKYPIIVIDAALIYELSLEHMFDAVVVVSSRMQNRIERIKSRDKLSQKEITDRIHKQLPIEEKMNWADFVIENNGSLEDLKKESRQIYQRLMRLARKKMKTSKAS